MKTLAMVLVTVSLMGVAHADHGKGGKDGKDRWGKMAKEIGLTPEQLKKVQEIKEARKKSLGEKREASMAAHKAFNEAMKSSAGKDELLAKFDAANETKGAFKREKFLMMLDLRALLTPEQLAKYRSLHADERPMKGFREAKERRQKKTRP